MRLPLVVSRQAQGRSAFGSVIDTNARLYFAGAGTHPGADLPGTLLSAEIADCLVAEELGVGAPTRREHLT